MVLVKRLPKSGTPSTSGYDIVITLPSLISAAAAFVTAGVTRLVAPVVEELDRGGALPDGGGHPLHRARAHVADREHPRQAGLELERPAAERPLGGLEVGGREIEPGLDEALWIEGHTVAEPAGVRVGARHGEDVAEVAAFARRRPPRPPPHAPG